MDFQPAGGHSLPVQPSRTPSDDVDDKKELGESYVHAQGDGHGAEYSDFLVLKEKYDNDPKALRKLIRKCKQLFIKGVQHKCLPNTALPVFLNLINDNYVRFNSGSPRGRLPLVLLLYEVLQCNPRSLPVR